MGKNVRRKKFTKEEVENAWTRSGGKWGEGSEILGTDKVHFRSLVIDNGVEVSTGVERVDLRTMDYDPDELLKHWESTNGNYTAIGRIMGIDKKRVKRYVLKSGILNHTHVKPRKSGYNIKYTAEMLEALLKRHGSLSGAAKSLGKDYKTIKEAAIARGVDLSKYIKKRPVSENKTVDVMGEKVESGSEEEISSNFKTSTDEAFIKQSDFYMKCSSCSTKTKYVACIGCEVTGRPYEMVKTNLRVSLADEYFPDGYLCHV
jgi:hypothetical protein